MRRQLARRLRWMGRLLALLAAGLPFTGLIAPGGPAAWGLLLAAAPLLLLGDL